jgi:hypothetical protein
VAGVAILLDLRLWTKGEMREDGGGRYTEIRTEYFRDRHGGRVPPKVTFVCLGRVVGNTYRAEPNPARRPDPGKLA